MEEMKKILHSNGSRGSGGSGLVVGVFIEFQIQWSCRTRDNSIYRRVTVSTRSGKHVASVVV